MSEQRLLTLATLVVLGVVAGSSDYVLDTVPAVHRSLIVSIVIAVLIMVATSKPSLVMGLVPLLGLALSVRASQTYYPLLSGDYQGEARLVTDPRPTAHGWRAEAKLETGRRVVLSGSGFSADPLGRAGAGQVVMVEGRTKPAPDLAWFRSRHLVGTLVVDRVEVMGGVRWYQVPSEWLRGAVVGGARTLRPGPRNLYLGLVIGDDRFQFHSQRAQFRTAGLSHLLAVSGQNVAFVLAVAAPVLRRLGIGNRFALTLGLLVVFAIATRMEASVLRATVAAGIATWSIVLGRRSSGLRTLCLAVIMLLLIDPLLAQSVGFALSVAASLGILMLGPAINRRVPGPAVLSEPLSVTLAAQLGVSPLLLWIFGPVSIVSVPANALAGWAAGGVMTWGLTIGVLAGLAPDWLASILQIPAVAMVWWIDAVARWASRAPAPALAGTEAIVLLVSLVWLWWIRDWAGTTVRVLRAIILAAGLALSIGVIPVPPQSGTELLGGGTWWIETASGRSILVIASDADNRLIDDLVAHRIRSVDLVILEGGHRRLGQIVADVERVAVLGEVLAPADHRVIGGRRLLESMLIPLQGGDVLSIESTESGLLVSVSDGPLSVSEDPPSVSEGPPSVSEGPPSVPD